MAGGERPRFKVGSQPEADPPLAETPGGGKMDLYSIAVETSRCFIGKVWIDYVYYLYCQ